MSPTPLALEVLVHVAEVAHTALVARVPDALPWASLTTDDQGSLTELVQQVHEGFAPWETTIALGDPPSRFGWAALSPQARRERVMFVNVTLAMFVSLGLADPNETLLFDPTGDEIAQGWHEGQKDPPSTPPFDFGPAFKKGPVNPPSPLASLFVSSLGKGLGMGVAEFLGKLPGIAGAIEKATVPTDEPPSAPAGTVAVPVRVNGRVRTFLDLLPTATEEDVRIALDASDVIRDLRTRMVETERTYVPGRVIEIAMTPVP